MNFLIGGLTLVFCFFQASNANLFPFLPLPPVPPTLQCLQLSRFQTLVIFGDSTSDTGNVYQLTNGKYPIKPYYYDGRYSNGPNWVDQLGLLNLEIKNYAYGSATTDNNLVKGYAAQNTVLVPGMLQQVQLYLNQTAGKNVNFANTLFVFYGGANDYSFNPALTPFQVAASLILGVQTVLAAGGQNVVVFNFPPVQIFPYTQPYNNSLQFTQLVTYTNLALTGYIKPLQAAFSNASLYVFDLNKAVSQWTNKPTSYFTDVTDGCYNAYNLTTVQVFCSNPDKYVFQDGLHFTTRAQGLLAGDFRPFFYNSYQVNNAACYVTPVANL